MQRFWPTWRAVLIAVALLLAAIDGTPRTPPAVMDGWPALLRGAREATHAAQDAVLEQVSPIRDAFQIGERWALFSSSRQRRYRMWIETRAGERAPWTLAYRPHDRDHSLFSEVLEYRRVRGSWNPNARGPRGAYDAFVSWIARRIFVHDPRVEAVRVRMEQIDISPRGEGITGTGRFEHEEVRRRSEALP